MTERKNIRICLAASAGGHTSQLLKLRESWKGYETFLITTADIVQKELKKYGRVYVVEECNRQNLWKVIKVLTRCFRLIAREKPNVVISTGAAVGCMACLLGKMLGAKVVWVDSITNVDRISLSGRMVRYVADLFLVQWPELAQQYRNVEYVGAVV